MIQNTRIENVLANSSGTVRDHDAVNCHKAQGDTIFAQVLQVFIDLVQHLEYALTC